MMKDSFSIEKFIFKTEEYIDEQTNIERRIKACGRGELS